MLFLSGCDALVDSSTSAASITGRAVTDAVSVWSDVFTYHGKPVPQLPQTRYCYKMMTDIVCYDSLQPSLTAQLVGYQDGTHQSWIQPGGGSLGASGGDPVAFQSVDVTNDVHKPNVIKVEKTLETRPAESTLPQYGEIQSVNLPAK